MTDLITAVGAAMLLGAVVFYVAVPLAASRRRSFQQMSGVRVRQLSEQKEQIYATIKELEFDHQLGKLLEADYLRLREEMEGQALAILHDLDQLDGGADAEVRAGIEQQILERRGGTGAAAVCPSCSSRCRPGDLFCAHCGTRLANQSQ